MVLYHRTCLHLKSEGIVRPENMIEFTTYKSWKKSLRTASIPQGFLIQTTQGKHISQYNFQFLARYLMRLKVADVAVECYSKTNHPLDAVNMVWDQRLNNFQVEVISILEWKKGNHYAYLPIISNKLSMVNFFEAYDIFDGDYIVKNSCPVNWVLRDDVVVVVSTTLAPPSC